MNVVILKGNLTKDIQLRTAGDFIIGNTSLAINARKKDGSNEVDYIPLTLFNKNAEIARTYLKKGSGVLIEGRLKMSDYTDQNGVRKITHSVVVDKFHFIDSKKEAKEQDKSYAPQVNYQSTQNTLKESEVIDVSADEDEIPF